MWNYFAALNRSQNKRDRADTQLDESEDDRTTSPSPKRRCLCHKDHESDAIIPPDLEYTDIPVTESNIGPTQGCPSLEAKQKVEGKSESERAKFSKLYTKVAVQGFLSAAEWDCFEELYAKSQQPKKEEQRLSDGSLTPRPPSQEEMEIKAQLEETSEAVLRPRAYNHFGKAGVLVSDYDFAPSAKILALAIAQHDLKHGYQLQYPVKQDILVNMVTSVTTQGFNGNEGTSPSSTPVAGPSTSATSSSEPSRMNPPGSPTDVSSEDRFRNYLDQFHTRSFDSASVAQHQVPVSAIAHNDGSRREFHDTASGPARHSALLQRQALERQTRRSESEFIAATVQTYQTVNASNVAQQTAAPADEPGDSGDDEDSDDSISGGSDDAQQGISNRRHNDANDDNDDNNDDSHEGGNNGPLGGDDDDNRDRNQQAPDDLERTSKAHLIALIRDLRPRLNRAEEDNKGLRELQKLLGVTLDNHRDLIKPHQDLNTLIEDVAKLLDTWNSEQLGSAIGQNDILVPLRDVREKAKGFVAWAQYSFNGWETFYKRGMAQFIIQAVIWKILQEELFERVLEVFGKARSKVIWDLTEDYLQDQKDASQWLAKKAMCRSLATQILDNNPKGFAAHATRFKQSVSDELNRILEDLVNQEEHVHETRRSYIKDRVSQIVQRAVNLLLVMLKARLFYEFTFITPGGELILDNNVVEKDAVMICFDEEQNPVHHPDGRRKFNSKWMVKAAENATSHEHGIDLIISPALLQMGDGRADYESVRVVAKARVTVSKRRHDGDLGDQENSEYEDKDNEDDEDNEADDDQEKRPVRRTNGGGRNKGKRSSAAKTQKSTGGSSKGKGKGKAGATKRKRVDNDDDDQPTILTKKSKQSGKKTNAAETSTSVQPVTRSVRSRRL